MLINLDDTIFKEIVAAPKPGIFIDQNRAPLSPLARQKKYNRQDAKYDKDCVRDSQ